LLTWGKPEWLIGRLTIIGCPTVHRAMLTGIAEHLKIEYEPPTDPTPELADLLRRLDDEKDKQK
jgi:hypothetical protein